MCREKQQIVFQKCDRNGAISAPQARGLSGEQYYYKERMMSARRMDETGFRREKEPDSRQNNEKGGACRNLKKSKSGRHSL